jgi:CelD/BcsL family acetyltransferase involved in cellulose biosynthesis
MSSALATAIRPAVAPAPVESARVACITDLVSLRSLRPAWDDLLAASTAAGPFLTWEWLSAWCTHVRPSADLRILNLTAGGRLIAVAPLLRTRAGLGLFPQLGFLGTGHAGSDYLDLIVRRGHEDDAVRAIAGVVGEYAVPMCLDHVSETSVSAQLAEQLQFQGWSSLVVPGGVCPVVRLAGQTWDGYLQTLGSAHRANIRRRLRALERQFRVEFVQVSSELQRAEALDALFGFHDARFEHRGSAFQTASLRAFHGEVTRSALERGWLRMYALRLDDAVAGVMYGFARDNQFYFYQHGFDIRHQQHSVGLVVMALSIRAAIDERLDAFDMLWGTEPYKNLWTSDARLLRRIHLFPPTIAGSVRHAAVRMRRRLAPLARAVLTAGDGRG